MVVVGAGFIGAEVAATCRERGLEVTMLEALPAPLARVLGEVIGGTTAEVHRDHGVDVRTGVGVAGLAGGARVERVELDDGRAVDADVVVVGVGVTPVTGWLEGSGLTLEDGVVCDETCLAAPGVVAAGDVARWPNRTFGQVMRVEHWDNALDQGAHAAPDAPGRRGRGHALRAGAVVLVGPVRPQAAAGRPRRARATTSRWCRARSRSVASSPSSAAKGGSPRRSA